MPMCPLKFNSATIDIHGERYSHHGSICEQEGCAWWRPDAKDPPGQCAILDIARTLASTLTVDVSGTVETFK